MSKKFTMLLVSLLAFVGVAWAQPEVGKEYRIKEASQELYLTIRGYNGQGEAGAYGTVPLLKKEDANVNQVWTLEASGTENVYYVKSKSGYYLRHGGWNVNAYNNDGAKAKVEFVAAGETYKIKNIDATKWWKSQSVGGDNNTWHPFCDAAEGAAATWALEEVPDSEFGNILFSTDNYKFYYNIQNLRVNKYANFDGDGAFSETSELNAGSYWYFVDATSKLPAETEVPEGFIACYIFNAANGKAVQNHSNGNMNDIDAAAYPAKIYYIRKHTKDDLEGYAIHDYSNSESAWNDNAGSAVTNWGYDDRGSIWNIVPIELTKDQAAGYTNASKNTATTLIAAAKEASYFTYSADAIAAAEGVVNAVKTDNIFNALSGSIEVEVALNTLKNSEKTGAPAAGDVIQLKNRQYDKYLKANDANLTSDESRSDMATLWVVEEGADGNVKLKNYSTNKYIGEIRQSEEVAMVESENAKQFAWTNQASVYAVFKETTGGDYAYGHIAGHNVLVGWEAGAAATQWIVSNVCPLSIIYLYNDQELGTSTTIVEKGTTHTVSSSPYDFTKISACKKGEEALEATDGVYSFEVTEATTLTIELEDDVPFVKTTLNEDGSFPENTTWYVVKQHSSQGYAWTWKYDETNGVTAESGLTTGYTDNHLWCFAGSKDNLKIYNKVAGKGYSLTNTDPASMAAENAAVWKMVKSNKEDSFAGKNPFCLQNGSGNSYLNAQTVNGINKLKYWTSRDQGSTIMVIAQQPLSIKYMYKGAELTDLSVNKLVDEGSTYTVTNPYANKYVNVGCTVNGNRVDAVNGQWTVNVTEPTSIIVTITEDLPFKTSASFATANWQYLQMNSDNWKYMKTNSDNTSNTSTQTVSELGDDALWAFVGDALNGFQIWNKAVEGAVLTVDNSNDGTAAYMKASGDQKWTIEKGNGGFILRQGTNECLNDHGGGGVMKIWPNASAPTGAGSAFRTISGGVKNLSDLYNSKIYVLQAERSQLLYDANASDPSKLSSGMANNVAVNGNDGNQQFMIFSSATEGAYYLYNVGAAKFVDANLKFTDYPEPVLSFEANEGNPVFPWFVKIADKYVVPSAYGDAGNSLYHTETPSADAGKWYRIVEVDEDMSLAINVSHVISHAEGLLKDASSLSNSKVYTVSTYDHGGWCAGDEALTHTMLADAEAAAQQFAFLTVGGKTYLYSVGAEKFVVMSAADENDLTYTAYSDVPTQPVVLLKAKGNKFFPFVVAFGDANNNHHIGISPGYNPSVITFWNDDADAGNKVDICEAGELASLADVVTSMEAYLNAQTLVPALEALIEKANSLIESVLTSNDATALSAAKDEAEDVLAGSYNSDQLNEQIEKLTTAINNAIYVTAADGFNNDYVYTFVSKRGWMVATESDATVKSIGEGAAANELHQWAVYKSAKGNYYLYNIGKEQFMGIATSGNIPFAATPQMTTLTFKKSNWEDYPIMFSVDDQGAVNNDKNGNMIYWAGGWTNLADDGNNHKVTAIGKVTDETLATIEAAVELYETQGVAVQALEKAIAAAQVKVDGMGEGLGYYSSTDADAAATLAAIVEFKNAITTETTVADIEAQTTAANELAETFSVNLPEAGKFYRFSYKYGEDDVKYVQAVASNAPNKANAMVMTADADQGTASIFYYADGKLLSYSAGKYVKESGDTRGLQAVDAEAGVAKFEAGSVAGKLYIFAGDSFHANKDGDICFIDHCGSGHPDKGASDEHNFTVEEVDMTGIFEELKPLAAKANDVAELDYLSKGEKDALTTIANAITEGTITSDPTARVNDMIDAAMNVMTHYDLSNQLFRLKQVASGRYMVFADGAKIAAKAENAVSQAFNFVATDSVGVYKLKSTNNLYMQRWGNYGYKAAAESDAALETDLEHGMEYIGRGKYNLHTTSGYIASDDIEENSALWSNKGKDEDNAVWELEPVKKTTVVYTLKHEGDVITTEEHSAYVGFAYPALETTYFGVTASEIPTGVITEEAIEEDGKIYVDITLTVGDLPFEYADEYATITKWYYLRIHYTDKNYLYYNTSNASQLDATKKEVDAANKDAYTWAFIGDPIKGFKVVNKLSTEENLLYLNATLKENPSVGKEAHVWTLTSSAYATNGFFMACSTEGAGSGERLNKNQTAGIVKYWDGADGGSTFIVEERDLSGASELQKYIDDVVTPLLNELGDGTATAVGYVTSDSYNALVGAKNNASNAVETKENVNEAQIALQTAVHNLKTIQPTVGTYYFIQNTNTQKYMSVAVGTGMVKSDNAGMSELFQFVSAKDGKFYLYNVERGTYLSTASVHGAGQNFAGAVEFTSAKAVTIANLGATNEVSIIPDGGVTLHHDSGQGTIVGWNDGQGSKSSWKIMEADLTNLDRTVTVGATGYSTLYLNYATIVPEINGAGNGVFVASAVGDDNVSLAAVAAGTVLPAKTGVIIKAEANTTLSFAYTSEKGSVTSMFEGSLFNKIITPEANTTCYVLAKPAAEEGEEDNPVGLYKAALNKDTDEDEIGDSFLNNANKIYLSVNIPSGQSARALTFRFGGTTSIEDAELTIDNETTVIYDLTGRRINEIVEKGIYIVNGKKVIVK